VHRHQAREVLKLTGETAVGCPPGSVVCFDLETTGLSGGAGTVAFLVGLGWFESGAFHTCQYFLSHLWDEAPMLRAVAQVLAKAHTVVTFNGRSFDGPVTDTRFAFHRQPSPSGRCGTLTCYTPVGGSGRETNVVSSVWSGMSSVCIELGTYPERKSLRDTSGFSAVAISGAWFRSANTTVSTSSRSGC